MRKQRTHIRRGNTNYLTLLVVFSLLGAAVLTLGLYLSSRPAPRPRDDEGPLFLYCAAGMRYPIEEIIARYRDELGGDVTPTYGGSNTLLSQMEVNRTGDLYLAADSSYTQMAREKGLVDAVFPLATIKPVIAVARGNPHRIESVEDLYREGVVVALGNPDAAAVGKKTKKLLAESGHWQQLEQHTTRYGVFKPTVNEVANDVKLGSATAGIVWDSTVAQYPELEAISIPELDQGLARVELCVLSGSKHRKRAREFARYASSEDRGLEIFRKHHFQTLPGDAWSHRPELTFYAGAVNRRALEPIIRSFEELEGATVNVVYNGCGILTAQMESIREKSGSGFPDTFMACDQYYLDQVQSWFQPGVQVSDTEIVLVVQPGNPKNLRTLEDLTQPGVRLVVGHPQQCTIGVLTRKLFESAGLVERVRANIQTETASSALLVPAITTRHADAVIAYRTDTLSEADKLEVVSLNLEGALAIQPFSIAKESPHQRLAERFLQHIRQSRDSFESAGFRWRLEAPESRDTSASNPQASAKPPSP